jgi:hypothetical protein
LENENSAYAVLLSQPETRDPMALAKALSTVRKTPLQDQVVLAKNCWGIVSDQLRREEAEALAQSLGRAGMPCQSCPTSSIPTLPPVEEVVSIASLPSAPPVLIASAAITLTSTTTRSVKEGPSATQKILSTGLLLTTGLPIHIGGKERTVEKTSHHSDLAFYLDLIYQNPSRRLRANAQKFDYAFLKERKLYQVFGNFKLLVGDVVKASPDAIRNHGTRVLLEGKPIQTMGYSSLEDIERECRWLLALQKS